MQRFSLLVLGVGLVCSLGMVSFGRPESTSILRRQVPVALTERVQFVSASGKIDGDAVVKAVAKRADGTRLDYGPMSSRARPGHSIFAFSMPIDATAKDAVRLVKKGGRKPASLLLSSIQFIRADGEPVELGGGFGSNVVREAILGMTSEMRWVFVFGSVLTILYEPGRMDSEELLKRIEMQAKDYLERGGKAVYLRDEFLWELDGDVKPAKAKSLEKKLLRMDGVVDCGIDAASGRVRIVVAYDQLETTGPWTSVTEADTDEPSAGPSEPADPAADEEEPSGELERPTFFINPLLTALAKAGFVVPE